MHKIDRQIFFFFIKNTTTKRITSLWSLILNFEKIWLVVIVTDSEDIFYWLGKVDLIHAASLRFGVIHLVRTQHFPKN